MEKKIIVGILGIIAVILLIPSVNAVALVDNFQVNATVTIDAGVYDINDVGGNGVIQINASDVTVYMRHVTLRGENVGIGLNITSLYGGTGFDNITIVAENVTISNYTIGVQVDANNDVTIYGNATDMFTIYNNTQNGVQVDDASDFDMQYFNSSYNWHDGVHIYSGLDGYVLSNFNITGNKGDGIDIDDTNDDIYIANGYIFNNGNATTEYSITIIGAVADYTNNVTVYNNRIRGATITRELYLNETSSVNVSYNYFLDANYGALISQSTGVTFQDNEFDSPLNYGIYIEDAGASLLSNLINDTKNGWAIAAAPNATANSGNQILIYNSDLDHNNATGNIMVNGTPNAVNISYNSIANTNDTAINMSSLNNTLDVHNNVIGTTGIGIQIDTAINSTGSVIRNTIAEASTGLYMDATGDTFTFDENAIAESVTYHFNISNNVNLTILNTTHNHTSWKLGAADTSALITNWYVRIRVEDSTGASLSGAVVHLYNANSTEQFTETLGSTGNSTWNVVTQDWRNGTGILQTYNDYNATAIVNNYNWKQGAQLIDSSETITVALSAVTGGGGGQKKATSTLPLSISPEEMGEAAKGFIAENIIYLIAGTLVALAIGIKAKKKIQRR